MARCTTSEHFATSCVRAEFRFAGSDSEVVLAAFDEWGIEETLPRLIGMFGIALWDRELQELVLIRDVMGIKPLYVAQTARGVAFASELGALTEAPGFDATLDSQATLAFLRYLYVPGLSRELTDGSGRQGG